MFSEMISQQQKCILNRCKRITHYFQVVYFTERIGDWTFSITTILEHLQSKYEIQVEDSASIGSTNHDVYHPFQHNEIDSHESKVQNYLLFRCRWTLHFATLKTTLTSPIDFSQATIHIFSGLPFCISFDNPFISSITMGH